LLEDSGLLATKPSTTPFDCSLKLHDSDSPPYEDETTYRRLVGRLLYLTTTRPDIAFIVQQLSQFISQPLQSTVSRSSSEAEYRALASLTCELQWLQYLFKDLHISLDQPISVYCDNKSAIYL
ncbi:Putative mitochondrial protein, partial [Glycine soja]